MPFIPYFFFSVCFSSPLVDAQGNEGKMQETTKPPSSNTSFLRKLLKTVKDSPQVLVGPSDSNPELEKS